MTTKVTSSMLDQPPAFTRSFTSSNQTITAAGALTLAHGLGSAPSMAQPRLKCLTAELGYSIGDELIVSAGAVGTNLGLSLVLTSVNVVVRFGSDAGVMMIVRKDTGATAAITPASWALIVRAWA